jgi:hypothetical protein
VRKQFSCQDFVITIRKGRHQFSWHKKQEHWRIFPSETVVVLTRGQASGLEGNASSSTMANALACRNHPGINAAETAGATNHQEAVMHDMVTVDALHELAARDEEQQRAVVTAMIGMMQQSQLLMAALLAQANEQAPVVRRR